MVIKLFNPHPGQKKIIDGFADSEHKFGIVSTGRQFGKSLLAQNLALYWLLKNHKTKCGWVAPIYRQSEKVFEEMSGACKDIIKALNKSQLKITFINGSQIQFLSADNYDSIRGYSFEWLIIDEAAFIVEKAINEAIIPTLTAKGIKCLIISTPRSKNWFYQWFLRGQEQSSTHISYEGISADNPYADANFIEEQRQSLPEEIFKQEYLAQFSESTNDVFRNLDLITILEEWNEPEPGRDYFVGIDSAVASDYSVCAIFDEGGTAARIIRVKGESLHEVASTFISHLKRYNIRGCYVETNGIGQGMFELIRKGGIKCKPFVTTNESKTMGVRKLISAIENGDILLPSKRLMPECYNELSAYTYKINATGNISFSHPPSGHDDVVDAIWMANLARNELFGDSSKSLYIGNNGRFLR